MNDVLVQRIKAWLPVALCILVLPLCALIIRPWVEIGIVDDWSYTRTAQIFAETGHVVYNGGATAMLGWQILVGALMFKLFGFSFTAARIGTLLVAMGTGALMQRLYVRLGLTEWNSAAATLLFLCSPPMIATSFSFMSDVYGMLVLLGCCYCCVRALQTADQATATRWVCAAAAGTALGGTARQIAWLGLLVMVPCTLWLLRRNRRALWVGGVFTLISIAFVPASLHWFTRQPYCLPESVLPAGHTHWKLLLLSQLPDFFRLIGFELLFLAFPLLVGFVFVVRRQRRVLLAVGLVLVYWILRVPHLLHTNTFHEWTVPYMINNLWTSGWEDYPAYLGKPALLLTTRVRLVLTAMVLVGELGLIGLLFQRHTPSNKPAGAAKGRSLSSKEVSILLVPCVLAYVLLLVPRYLGVILLDRYLIFPDFVFLGACVLLYQAKIGKRLPSIVWVMVSAYVLINAMGMHDAFNLFRTQAKMLDGLQRSGVPRTQMDGGFQFNGWTQIQGMGHLNDMRIRVPAGAYQPTPVIHTNDPCRTQFLDLTPSVHARYVVSFDPHACGGATGIEESYSTWLGRKRQTLYMVKGPE